MPATSTKPIFAAYEPAALNDASVPPFPGHEADDEEDTPRDGLQLDYERLQPLNPRLVYVSMSGYGHSGPRRDWTSMNMNLQGISGLMLLTGAEGDPPTAISNSWNDYIGGLHGSFEVLEALARRAETGVGQYIDLGQFEASVGTLGPLLLSSIVNREAPPRLGNRSTTWAPQGCYPCRGEDEWCTLAVQTDEHWRALGVATGNPPWMADPRFEAALGRMQHHDEIDQRISAWTSEFSSAEVEQKLRNVGVPADRMRRADAIIGAPDAGGGYVWLETAYGKPTVAARLPYTFSASAAVEPEVVPEFGSNTRSALQRWLDFSESEIDALEAAGALN